MYGVQQSTLSSLRTMLSEIQTQKDKWEKEQEKENPPFLLKGIL